MCNLPIPIDNDERIVRVILCPVHLKRGKLKAAAFRSRVGTDDLSTIRHSFKGSNFCKHQGVRLGAASGTQQYVGLAVILAESIRAAGSQVADSREVYCGHAHISHGIVLPANDPPSAEDALRLTERCKALIEHTNFFPDQSIDAASWTGPEIS